MTIDEALAFLDKKLCPMADGFVVFVPPHIRPPEYVTAIEAGLTLRAEIEKLRDQVTELHALSDRNYAELQRVRDENEKLREENKRLSALECKCWGDSDRELPEHGVNCSCCARHA